MFLQLSSGTTLSSFELSKHPPAIGDSMVSQQHGDEKLKMEMMLVIQQIFHSVDKLGGIYNFWTPGSELSVFSISRN